MLLFAGGLFLANALVLGIDATGLPLVQDFSESGIGFGILTLVVGTFLPVIQDSAVTLEFVRKFWVLRKVPDFMRVVLKVVEFLFRARTEKDLLGERGKGSGRVPLPEKDDVIAIVPILRLKERAIGKEVPDVTVTISAYTPDIIDGVITPIAGGDDVLAGLEIIREEIHAIEIARYINAGESEAGARDIEGGC